MIEAGNSCFIRVQPFAHYLQPNHFIGIGLASIASGGVTEYQSSQQLRPAYLVKDSYKHPP
jgi:hypothetical protein